MERQVEGAPETDGGKGWSERGEMYITKSVTVLERGEGVM